MAVSTTEKGQGSLAPATPIHRRKSAGEVFAGEGESFEVADGGNGDLLGLEELAGGFEEFVAGNGFDGGNGFVHIEKLAEVELLAGQVGHARAGGFEGKHERAFEVVLGAAQFFFRGRLGFQFAELFDDGLDHLAGGFASRAGINEQHTGVAVAGVLAEDGVGEGLPLADILEEARRHGAAENIVEQRGGKAPGMRDGIGRDAEADVNLLELFFVAERDARVGFGQRVREAVRHGRDTGEGSGGELDETLVFDIAGGGDDKVIGYIPVLKNGEDRVAGEILYRVTRAEDGFAEGVAAPEILREGLVDEIFGIVLIHFDFFEDDGFFLDDVVFGEARPKDEVGDDVESDGKVLVENFGVEADHFFGGESIEHSADGVHFARDGFCAAALGAFEDHVFNEVRDAVAVGRLAAGTGRQPDADGNGADVGHLLGDHHQAVRQDFPADVASFRLHTFR